MLIGLAVGGPAGIAAGPSDKAPLVTAHLCGEVRYRRVPFNAMPQTSKSLSMVRNKGFHCVGTTKTPGNLTTIQRHNLFKDIEATLLPYRGLKLI